MDPNRMPVALAAIFLPIKRRFKDFGKDYGMLSNNFEFGRSIRDCILK